ncbi:MAG: MIP family channel protein [Planctomycetaceae bacterium]
MQRGLTRELAAEFLGTLVLMTFGTAVVAQVVLGDGKNGDYLSINLGWGLAVTLGVYAAGGVSGAHLNPAVTLTLAVMRGFPWNKVLPFILVQFAAAFVASVLVYATYHEALDNFDGGQRQVSADDGPRPTAGIWATSPQPYLSNVPGALVDQIVGTAMLLLMIFALSDQHNLAPPANLAPLLVGATVFMIGMTFGLNCGYAINPARDLGPRLFLAVGGWGSRVFTADNYYFWVPVVGPCIGGLIGGLVYDVLVTRLHKRDAES